MKKFNFESEAEALETLRDYWERIEKSPTTKRWYRELFEAIRGSMQVIEGKKNIGFFRPRFIADIGGGLDGGGFRLEERVGLWLYDVGELWQKNESDDLYVDKIEITERKVHSRQPVTARRIETNTLNGKYKVLGEIELDQWEDYGVDNFHRG